MIVALHALSLAKFGEVDSVPVSKNSPNTNMHVTIIYEEITNLYENRMPKILTSPTKNASEVVNPINVALLR